MTIYLLQVFTILLLSAGIHPRTSEKKKKLFLILIFLVLTVVSGIRGYRVGADTPIYVALFNNIDYISASNVRFEPGFIIYAKLLHRLSTNPSILLFTSSAICIGSVCYFIFRYSKSPTISVLLYVLLGSYFSQMNVMRQALAMSISMWGFLLILDEKNQYGIRRLWSQIASVTFILLAMSFHTPSVVMMIPWVLLFRQGEVEEESKLTMQYAIARVALLSTIVFLGYSVVMHATTLFFPKYVSYFYSEWSDSNYNAALFNTLIDIVFFSLWTVSLQKKRLTHLQRFSAIMVGFSIIFHVLSMRMEIWGRIAGYFSIYTYLIWTPETLSEFKLRTNRRLIRTAIVTLSLLYMIIVLVFRPEWSMVVPYEIAS